MAHERDHDDKRHRSPDESDHDTEPFHASSHSTIFDNVTPEFWERLIAFARKRRSRHGARANKLPEPKELLAEAVVRVMSGDRHYDGTTDLFSFLCSVINSLLWHETTRAANSHAHMTIAADGDEPGTGAISERYFGVIDDAVEKFLMRDSLEHLTERLEPDLQAYIHIRLNGGYDTEEERAAAMQTTVEDLRNRIRRIRRKAKALGLLDD
ncbi:MAG TPA: hypothetical protein VHW00_24735 [Thermoanaerobaculia bacterium]|nr:hypothetical protein [Thermoanaerobaculia bacterium]